MRRRLLATKSTTTVGKLIIVVFVILLTAMGFIHQRNSAEFAQLLLIDSLGLLTTIVSLWFLKPGAIGLGIVYALTYLTLDASTTSTIFFPVLILRAGTTGQRRFRILISVWLSASAFALTWKGDTTSPISLLVVEFFFYGALIVVLWFVGDFVHDQRREITRLDLAREEAVREVRLSVARDLHDAVASSSARIVLRAEQAKLRGISDPELDADLDYILAAARQSGRDLRSMLSALRSTLGAAETSNSSWHIESIEEVLEERAEDLRQQGFVVNVAAMPLPDLAQSVRDTVGKFFIEATANAIKYADRTKPCHIHLSVEDDLLEAAVLTQRRKQTQGNDPVTSSGMGLLGLRERASVVGGRLDVRSTTDQFSVRIEIPLADAPESESPAISIPTTSPESTN